jgi:hypothetical protein
MKRTNYEVLRLVNYAKKATPEELMDDYGIEIVENSKVYDTIYDTYFKNLTEWAEDVVGIIEEDVGNRKTSKYEDEEY